MDRNYNPHAEIMEELRSQRQMLEQFIYQQQPINIHSDIDKYVQGLEMPKRVLGCKSGQMIYQNIGKIPHRKIHGKLYFNERELQEYIRSEGKK
jgi:hypothetical protein